MSSFVPRIVRCDEDRAQSKNCPEVKDVNMTAYSPEFKGNSHHNELASAKALMQAGQFAEALGRLLPVVKSGIQDLEILDCTSTCFFQLGDSDTAISLLKVATDNWPNVPALWGKLAAMCQSAGDRDGAITAYRRVLKFDPGSVNALSSLDLLAPLDRVSSKTTKLRKLTSSGKLSPQDLRTAHFLLGRIEERSGRHKVAFRHFVKANQSVPSTYDPSVTARKVADQEAKFSAVSAKQPEGEGVRPVFVTGLPRSGTTLVENALLRHSQTFSVGESYALSECLSAVRSYMANHGHSSGPWDWCDRITAEEIAAFRAHYLQRALKNSVTKAPVMIDKMPMNCFNIGLAQILFPEARFVFMSRHPLDVGLSNFKSNYFEGNAFTTRLDWMGATIVNAYRSVQDYKQKLGAQLRIQSFEALVRDPEDQIPSLLEHLGLDFEEACLSPEENQGAVRTASVSQVREKINTKGLGKWKPYEDQLQPLLLSLGGADWLDQWQSWDRKAAESGCFE